MTRLAATRQGEHGRAALALSASRLNEWDSSMKSHHSSLAALVFLLPALRQNSAGRKADRGRLLQDPYLHHAARRGAGSRRHRDAARRQGGRRHAPRRNLADRQRLRPPIRRRRSSRASPTACTRSSAWRRRTAGSTSPSGPTSSRIKDTNGHGKADIFEVVTDGWEINGDYHEYAFGSRFDKNGEIWITLCLTGSFNSNSKFRGWAMQGHARRQVRPDRQRRALARRRRLQRRGRRLLHRQPGAVERRLRASSRSSSAASSAIPTASSGTRSRKRSTSARPRRSPRAAAAS